MKWQTPPDPKLFKQALNAIRTWVMVVLERAPSGLTLDDLAMHAGNEWSRTSLHVALMDLVKDGLVAHAPGSKFTAAAGDGGPPALVYRAVREESSKFKVQSSKLDGGSTESRPTAKHGFGAPASMTTTVPPLRACPFCAARIALIQVNSVDHANPIFIRCLDCGAAGPPAKDGLGAVVGWNMGNGR